MKNILNYITVLFSIFIFSTVFSQNSKELINLQDKLYSDTSEEFSTALKKIDSASLPPQDKALYYYLYAKHLELDNQDGKAYEYLRSSKRIYKSIDSISKAMDINLDITYLLQSQEGNDVPYKSYIEEYITHAKKIGDSLRITRGYGNMATYYAYKGDYNESIKYYKRGLNLLKGGKHKYVESAFYNNLANLYNENLHKPDSGIYYLRKEFILLKETDASPEDYYHYYLNLASSYRHKKDFITANKYLQSADSLPINDYILKSKYLIYNNFHQNYAELKDYKDAYKYLLLTQEYSDSINATEQNIAIENIHTKYKTKEKELENEILRGNVKTKQVINYIVIGLLIVGSVIAFLIIKNARKKEKISHQEKLIEKQKLEKALKEYELSSIDIMLEGQEKERQRIANELHDNLGSMLATLKINFETLKLRKNDIKEDENRLYQKTDELIEEAYQKVRRLAHAKNAGVYASEGLIPALKKLVQKVSVPKKLKVDFIPYGFNERLDNSQEITIFRIVQELITNIIKHAQASEASIQLTNHDDVINIIIEDNGVGFNVEKITSEDGMGIASIQKKIDQLSGSFAIDSTPGKGTTIIIDLPI